MDVEVLELLRGAKDDSVEQAMAQIVANLKAKLQCALDGGDWANAWLFTGIRDPMEKPSCAGDEAEMVSIAGYRKAQADLTKQILDLRKKLDTTPTVDPGAVTEEQGTGVPPRGRGRGRQPKGRGRGEGEG